MSVSYTHLDVYKRQVMGTTTLLDACKEFSTPRYHQVSTDEVYGDLPLDRPDLFFTAVSYTHLIKKLCFFQMAVENSK